MVKIYCINLERAKDRRAQMEAQIKDQNLEMEFIDAFDSGKEGVTRDHVRPEIHPGEFGCLMSNYRVWQDMVDKGHSQALILEDDVILVPNFISKLESLELPEKWDVVYLEYVSPIYEGKATKDVNEGRCLGTMTYLISLEGAKKLLAFDPIDWRGADKQLAQLPIKSFYSKERLADHDLLNSGIGVDPMRIPRVHNGIYFEREYGGIVAFVIMMCLLFYLKTRLFK
jgi:hypothetical protein